MRWRNLFQPVTGVNACCKAALNEQGGSTAMESQDMSIFAHFSVAAVTVIAAGAFSLSCAAQTTAPNSPPTPRVHDCSKAPHPERCEAFKKAAVACMDKAAGDERRACIKANMPARPAGKSS